MLRTLATLLLLLPLTVLASGTAGFLDRPIWHTPESYFAGDAVRIYAAIMNTSNADVSGTLNFLVNEKVIGRRTFSLQANEVEAVWYDWKATSGSHSFSATISDTSFSAQGSSTVSAPHVVTASPVIVATTSVAKTEALQEASSTPPALSLGETIDTAAKDAQTALEGVRATLDDVIEKQRGKVAGTSTIAEDASFIESSISAAQDAATPPAVTEAKGFLATAWLFLLTFFRSIITLAIGILGSPFWTAVVLVVAFMLIMKLFEKVFRMFSKKAD